MNEQLKQWQHKIDALNQRERILLLVTSLVVVAMLLQTLLIDPVMGDRKLLQQQTKQLKQQIQLQSGELQVINAQLAAGINRHKIERRDLLQSEVKELSKKIEQSVVAMIPPRLMPEVLENILTTVKGLQLVSLENKPVVAVIEQAPEPAPVTDTTATSKQAMYKHGFVLRLRGNYMSAIRYFEALSELPWRFYWDDMHYKVDAYPSATITLEVHTVSMSEEWIGV